MTLLDKHGLGQKTLGSARPTMPGQRMMATILASSRHRPLRLCRRWPRGSHRNMWGKPSPGGESTGAAASESWDGVFGRRAHGDSLGVHASDAVNAWRNVARVSSVRNQAASLILAAGFVAESHRWSEDRRWRGHEKRPYPSKEHLDRVKAVERMRFSASWRRHPGERPVRACAVVQRYGEQADPRGRCSTCCLCAMAISEDGRLRGEKYYRTVVEEFASTRPAFRWRQLVALARVAASACGFRSLR